ncbi:type ISP restriction/modification enzyme [Psychrobacter pacificensis]|jgi:predicted helicase|uniref:type ISP restriction/modification enzyme n=1 Tax=Psychrobacter TaxID=497 RepID=UPI0008A71090|nr:type ISP restriction/modification enzyme [Psychrobacter sp. AntiMn-1]AOY43634.1 helicase [Psychrobacter sp. AntiMn-1]
MSDSNHQYVSDYVNKVASRVKLGHSSEHTFRKDLEDLINNLVPDVMVTNEPSQVTDCGNPDFLISKKEIPIGFIEAKDVGKDLSSKLYKEQFDRYKAALDNLIITDYLRFEFYVNGERVHQVCVGELIAGTVKTHDSEFKRLAELLRDFCVYVGQTIKSAQRLAVLMAGKARLLEHTLYQALISDEHSDDNSDLRAQFETFKGVLIHDLTPADFADIYAQTLAYGMFAARLHDDTLDTFSRQEAAELIPKTNPFLRKLFSHVAGIDIDPRIKTTVDNLADVFRATDVAAILKNFGKTTQTQDPIIHFYETFLAEYNPKLRKQRGVWYTPEPVVKFIVRAVDDILKSEFDLADGIADTSKIEIEKQTQTPDSRTKTGYKMVKELVHKVQILDPATGTGTFLAAIIQHIFHSQFENMGGIWSSYVEQDLLPRLHGFELLMASYAMAHLKLDMLLADTGYEPIKPKRMQVYLTNSLEEHNPDTGTLFAGWLSAEANEANAIKRDAPVMVVIGNPPYSGVSQNNGKWISDLIEDYKYVDGEHFNERKHWLNDDYVKFIRYGQHFIEKNGEGILAFINPHGFLDNPTFRGMRWHLLNTYDKIFTIDLHGNTKKKEAAPDGSKDENVFDIMQGVSINFFIKTGKKKQGELGKVFHYDLFGKRDAKYNFLSKKHIGKISFDELLSDRPYFFFKPRNNMGVENYSTGFKVDELVKINSIGFVSANNNLNISFDEIEQKNKIEDILTLDEKEWRVKYNRMKDAQSWKYIWAKQDAAKNKHLPIIPVSYKPFDIRYSLYTGNSGGLYARPVNEVMQHLFLKENYALVVSRQCVSNWRYIFISNLIGDFNLTGTAGRFGSGYFMPLYLYNQDSLTQSKLLNSDSKYQETPVRTPNLDPEIVADIAKGIGLTFTNEKEEIAGTFAPIDILDYIYAVLHSPTYRETYKEFLKIDFPRVPYPSDVDIFWQLVALGGELRRIHLLESPKLAAQTKALGIGYPVGGDNAVTRKMTKTSVGFEPDEVDSSIGKVWLNDTQYFTNVPLIAWEFYIGGYQPAQKWLKDRQGRTLDISDVKHYMNIIAALSLTNELMQQIDDINVVG